MQNTMIGAVLFVLAVFSQPVSGQGAGNEFREANEQYTKGEFGKAAELYHHILNNNPAVSPEVFFNLGNAYFRLQQPGKAMIFWERALRLDPRDADIRFNIDFAKQKLFAEPETQQAADIIVRWIQRLATLNEVSFAVLVVFSIASLSLMAYMLFKRSLFRGISVGAGILLLFLCLWLGVAYRYYTSQRGYVIVPRAEVHNGPDESIAVGFIAAEGTEIVFLRESGEWQEIGIPQKGLKGWVRKEMVEEI